MFKYGFHLVVFAGFALLVSACDLFGIGEKKYSEVKNCTSVKKAAWGQLERRGRKYCEWNESEKTLTVYKWKPGTGPSQVYYTTPPLNDSRINRSKDTIDTSRILFMDDLYLLDFDI